MTISPQQGPPRIVCAGDLHLGVLPSRLPPGADAASCSCAAVWRRLVDFTLESGAGLLLLAGDLVDQENRYFEAYGPLEEGLGRLSDAGILVCAVAGNHDFEVLPRLVELVGRDRLRLLGRGGGWERFAWRDPSGRVLAWIDGWSFPQRHVREDPLGLYDLEPPADGSPVFGLVHGDLDAAESPYAPLRRQRLETALPWAWVLGHVHTPRLVDLAAGGWALYPGSLQPLEPNERGPHGAWIFDLEGGRPGRPRQVALATVRYESVAVDLGACGSLGEAEPLVVERLRQAASDLLAENEGAVEWLLARLALVGRTPVYRHLAELRRRLVEEDRLELTLDEARLWVEDVRVDAAPVVDLEALALAESPPGWLARLLLAVDGEGEGEAELELERLLADAVRRLREVDGQAIYSGLPESDDPEELEARRLLKKAGWRLLGALVEQKERDSEEAPA